MEFESEEKKQQVVDIVNNEIKGNPKLADLRLMLKAGFLDFSYEHRDYPVIEINNSNFLYDYSNNTILTFQDNPDYEIYEDEDYFTITFESPARDRDCEGEYTEDGEYYEFDQYDYEGDGHNYREDQLEESLLYAQDYAVDKAKKYKVDLVEMIVKKEKDIIESELVNAEESTPSRKRRM